MQLKVGSFLFTPNLLPTLAFFFLLMGLLALGDWQLDRAQEKQALLEAKQMRRSAAALLLDGGGQVDPVLDRFRPAYAEGHYVSGQQWLLDNRLYQGLAGYHVFSLFQLLSGKQVLINRGWVSVGQSRQFLPNLPLPQGQMRLSGHLDSPASVGLVLGEQPYDSIAERVLLQNLDVAMLDEIKNLDLLPLTLVIDADQKGVLQYDWSAIEHISPEKHLGYAVQWFALAVALLIIYFGVNTRRISTGASSHAE
jgi:surfeit locus 1 family protein